MLSNNLRQQQQPTDDEEFARRLQAQELGEIGIDAQTPLMIGAQNIGGGNNTNNALNGRVQQLTSSWVSIGLITALYQPQIIAAVIVLALHWNDIDVCDYAHTVKWKTWAVFSALRMSTYVATLLFVHFFEPWLRQRPNYLTQAINFRNTVDAIGLIWFVVGNMWLFGDDDSSCRHPEASPIYNLCLSLLIINYIQFCLPCILAILLIPVFCFCMPCLIRLLARLQQHRGTGGATVETINALPSRVVEMMTFQAGEETTCPICLSEMAVGDSIRTLHCAHTFHQPCVDEWLRVNANCPTCRKRIDGSNNDEEDPPATGITANTTTTTTITTTTGNATATTTTPNTNTNTNTMPPTVTTSLLAEMRNHHHHSNSSNSGSNTNNMR